MLDRWNFPIGVLSLENIKVVKLIIYSQILKTYLDLKRSTESTLTMSLGRLPLHYHSWKKGIEIYVLSSLVKSISVVIIIPSSSLGIGVEVKIGINVNLMSTHFVE